MTHEVIANMLGVRREGVSEAAGRPQKLGVVSYKRGRIRVNDRARLERQSCECHAEMKRESDRMLAFMEAHSREAKTSRLPQSERLR